MKILRLCFLLFSLTFCVQHLNAQSVADLWISMPSDIAPYLDTNQKKEMIECQKIGVDTSVKNKFDGKTIIDTLTTDYGKFNLSEARTLEIAKLQSDADSIIMLIDTYKGPANQSRVAFYDLSWKQLLEDDKLPSIDLKDLIQKPDTMSVDDYENLQKMILPEFIEYNYDFKAKKMEISPSLPLVTNDEKNKINAIICKRTLIWDSKTFK